MVRSYVARSLNGRLRETLEALQEGKAIADAALVAGKRGVQGCHSRVSD